MRSANLTPKRSSSETTLSSALLILRLTHEVSEIAQIPILKGTVGALTHIVGSIEAVKCNKDLCRELAQAAVDMTWGVRNALASESNPVVPKIQQSVDKLCSELETISQFMKEQASLSRRKRYFYRDSIAQEIATYRHRLNQATAVFCTTVHIANSHTLQQLSEYQNESMKMHRELHSQQQHTLANLATAFNNSDRYRHKRRTEEWRVIDRDDEQLNLVQAIGQNKKWALHEGRFNSRLVTVKVFKGASREHDFLQEMNLYRAVYHPNLPQVLGASHLKSKPLLIVFKHGRTMHPDDWLLRSLHQGLHRIILTGLEITRGFLLGLQHLHETGILPRSFQAAEDFELAVCENGKPLIQMSDGDLSADSWEQGSSSGSLHRDAQSHPLGRGSRNQALGKSHHEASGQVEEETNERVYHPEHIVPRMTPWSTKANRFVKFGCSKIIASFWNEGIRALHFLRPCFIKLGLFEPWDMSAVTIHQVLCQLELLLRHYTSSELPTNQPRSLLQAKSTIPKDLLSFYQASVHDIQIDPLIQLGDIALLTESSEGRKLVRVGDFMVPEEVSIADLNANTNHHWEGLLPSDLQDIKSCLLWTKYRFLSMSGKKWPSSNDPSLRDLVTACRKKATTSVRIVWVVTIREHYRIAWKDALESEVNLDGCSWNDIKGRVDVLATEGGKPQRTSVVGYIPFL